MAPMSAATPIAPYTTPERRFLSPSAFTATRLTFSFPTAFVEGESVCANTGDPMRDAAAKAARQILKLFMAKPFLSIHKNE
jgi:hypothetical protein